jgi:hypothetical protein
MGSGGLTGDVAGERRRTSGGTAAGARILTRTGAERVNVWHGQLHWGQGKGLRRLVGSGIARGAELVDGCPAAAAGETTPASWQLERANKRAQELQGVLKEWGAARVGEEKQAGVEFTVWYPWRTAAARCSRGEKTGRLYSRAQGGEGGFLAYQGNQVMSWTAAWPEYGGMGGDARRPIAN